MKISLSLSLSVSLYLSHPPPFSLSTQQTPSRKRQNKEKQKQKQKTEKLITLRVLEVRVALLQSIKVVLADARVSRVLLQAGVCGWLRSRRGTEREQGRERKQGELTRKGDCPPHWTPSYLTPPPHHPPPYSQSCSCWLPHEPCPTYCCWELAAAVPASDAGASSAPWSPRPLIAPVTAPTAWWAIADPVPKAMPWATMP